MVGQTADLEGDLQLPFWRNQWAWPNKLEEGEEGTTVLLFEVVGPGGEGFVPICTKPVGSYGPNSLQTAPSFSSSDSKTVRCLYASTWTLVMAVALYSCHRHSFQGLQPIDVSLPHQAILITSSFDNLTRFRLARGVFAVFMPTLRPYFTGSQA